MLLGLSRLLGTIAIAKVVLGLSNYTGGSISTDEHRERMTKDLGRTVTWVEVYKQTRLKKSTKEQLKSKELEDNELEWANDKTKHTYELYLNGMKEKFGDDPTQYPPGDAEVWEKSVGGRKKGRLFGIGCSDLHYSVTGKSTFSCGMSSQSSSQEVNELRAKLEEERRMREEMAQDSLEREAKLREEMKTAQEEMKRAQEENIERQRKLQEDVQKQMDDFIRKCQSKDS